MAKVVSCQKRLREAMVAVAELRKELESTRPNFFDIVFRANAHRRHFGVANFDEFFEQLPPMQYHNSTTLSPRDQIMCFLWWLYSGLSINMCSDLFDIPATSLSRVFHRLLDELSNKWVPQQIRFPTIEEWIDETPETVRGHPSFQNTLLFFVDGTIFPSHEPSDLTSARLSWNTKHHVNGYSFTILVLPTGRIVYTSNLHWGSTHDKTVWREEDLTSTLQSVYSHPATHTSDDVTNSYTLGIGGDKGYRRLRVPEGWHLFVTQSGEVTGIDDYDMTVDTEVSEMHVYRDIVPDEFFLIYQSKRDNEHYAPEVASPRSVVERVFAKIKKWRSLSNLSAINRMKGMKVQAMVDVICALCNYNMNRLA